MKKLTWEWGGDGWERWQAVATFFCMESLSPPFNLDLDNDNNNINIYHLHICLIIYLTLWRALQSEGQYSPPRRRPGFLEAISENSGTDEELICSRPCTMIC